MNAGVLLTVASVAAGAAGLASLIGTIVSVRRARALRSHIVTRTVAELLNRNLAELTNQMNSLSTRERELLLEEMVRALTSRERTSGQPTPEGERSDTAPSDWPLTPA